MVTALLFFYPINHKHNYTEEKAAVGLNAEGFKRVVQRKQEDFPDPKHRNFGPLFLLQWMVAFWCDASSSFGWKYDRNYRPYF